MSVQAAEQVLSALQRVESLFTASDGAPVSRVEPQPLPQHSAARACYIGHEDADVGRLCPPGTTQVTYYDKSGNYVLKDLDSGAVTTVHSLGPDPRYPTLCHLASAGADRSICGPGTTAWSWQADDGSIVTETLLPNGKTEIHYTRPGPLVP
jgi:hypothetical protein